MAPRARFFIQKFFAVQEFFWKLSTLPPLPQNVMARLLREKIGLKGGKG